MIPKIIHYCWFGGAEKPIKLKNLIGGFKRLEKHGYEIIEWNESNYDVSNNLFTKEAFKKKHWAHVSDYVRLDVLYNYGGIYLDTDVEIVKPFDDILNYKMFLGFMWECNLGTAVLGVEKNHDLIKKLKKIYLSGNVSFTSPNNDLFTKIFLREYLDFRLNGREQKINEGTVLILEKERLEHPSFMKKKNYTIHHFSQSWKNSNKAKNKLKKIIINLLGLYIYRKYICRKSLLISPFYSIYKIHIKQK